MQCEVCGKIHRSMRYRMPAGGSVLLCASCRMLWLEMERWSHSQRKVSPATFLRIFDAHRSQSLAEYLIPPQKSA